MTGILFPLLIGLAINDLLKEGYQGIVYLGGAGIAALVLGSLRRFYDTRIYSGIYSKIAPEMVAKELGNHSGVSKISARASLLTEFVEYLENSMPEIVTAIISLFGILAIIATLSLQVFLACLGLLVLVFSIYGCTSKFNYSLNENYNNELEKQVDVIGSQSLPSIRKYYSELVKWNIKLSDLETANYFVIWMGVIGLFIYTPITVIGSGVLSYGLVFSVFMYVFDYIGSIVTFPIYIQQMIRLKEISVRLASQSNTDT